MREKTEITELAAAVEALQNELRRYEAMAENLNRMPLNSQKHLERAGRALHDIANVEERLGVCVRDLVAAISAARDLQQVQGTAVHARAQEIQERTRIYQELVQQFVGLGTDASELNRRLQEVANGEPTADGSDLATALPELSNRLNQVAAAAHTLARAAHDADFMDLARQADSLSQQLTAARNKLHLLGRGLAEA